MKYIFPRQFGLHNVFTCSVDSRETSHTLKDYTLREREIALSNYGCGMSSSHNLRTANRSLPRRLRGLLVTLIATMQKLHKKCSYSELLKHYCPVDVSHYQNRFPTALTYFDSSLMAAANEGMGSDATAVKGLLTFSQSMVSTSTRTFCRLISVLPAAALPMWLHRANKFLPFAVQLYSIWYPMNYGELGAMDRRIERISCAMLIALYVFAALRIRHCIVFANT